MIGVGGGKSLMLNKIQQQKKFNIFLEKRCRWCIFFISYFLLHFYNWKGVVPYRQTTSPNRNKNLLLLKLWHPVRVLIKASLFRTCVTCGKPSCRCVRDLHRILLEIAAYPSHLAIRTDPRDLARSAALAGAGVHLTHSMTQNSSPELRIPQFINEPENHADIIQRSCCYTP